MQDGPGHDMADLTDLRIGIVGPGDVGLPLAIPHPQVREIGAAGIRSFGRAPHVLYDLKYVLPAEAADLRL